MIRFDIPYTVQPKQADRSRIAKAKDGRQFVHHYQPKKVVENAASLAALVAPHRPDKPLEGPVGLEVTLLTPWRTSERAADRNRGWAWHSTKPDVENLLKQLNDVLEAAGFVSNDSQIARLVVEKKRHAGHPLVEVRLWKLGYKGEHHG